VTGCPALTPVNMSTEERRDAARGIEHDLKKIIMCMHG